MAVKNNAPVLPKQLPPNRIAADETGKSVQAAPKQEEKAKAAGWGAKLPNMTSWGQKKTQDAAPAPVRISKPEGE